MMSERVNAGGIPPPELMVLEEMMECRETGCELMLADLSAGRITPAECFPRYVERIDEAFSDREAELSVPYIRAGREAVQRLAAVREARRRWRERTGASLKKLAVGART